MKSKHQSLVKSKRELIRSYLDYFVPQAGGENAALGHLEPFNNLDWSIVLSDLLCLPS
jgi:hypothetical protein